MIPVPEAVRESLASPPMRVDESQASLVRVRISEGRFCSLGGSPCCVVYCALMDGGHLNNLDSLRTSKNFKYG